MGNVCGDEEFNRINDIGDDREYDRIVVNCPVRYLGNIVRLILDGCVRFLYDGEGYDGAMYVLSEIERAGFGRDLLLGLYARSKFVKNGSGIEQDMKDIRDRVVFDRVDWTRKF